MCIKRRMDWASSRQTNQPSKWCSWASTRPLRAPIWSKPVTWSSRVRIQWILLQCRSHAECESDPLNKSVMEVKAIESQAIGRAQRQGQTQQVTLVRFLVADSVETEVHARNTRVKWRLYEYVVAYCNKHTESIHSLDPGPMPIIFLLSKRIGFWCEST